jgi:uncharacterized RDD family membrane protein YckC
MTDATPRPSPAPRGPSGAAARPTDGEPSIPELGGAAHPAGEPDVSASASLARTLRSTQRAPGPAGQLLADAPNRAVALLLDMILLGVIGIAVAGSFGRALGGVITDRTLATSGGEISAGPFVVVVVLVFALSLASFVVCWTRWHATPGMRLLGLAILDESGGHALSVRQAVVRWLLVGIPASLATLPVWAPSLVAMLLAIIGAIALLGLLVTIGQDPARQGLHDRYSGSIVTTVSRRAARDR